MKLVSISRKLNSELFDWKQIGLWVLNLRFSKWGMERFHWNCWFGNFLKSLIFIIELMPLTCWGKPQIEQESSWSPRLSVAFTAYETFDVRCESLRIYLFSFWVESSKLSFCLWKSGGFYLMNYIASSFSLYPLSIQLGWCVGNNFIFFNGSIADLSISFIIIIIIIIIIFIIIIIIIIIYAGTLHKIFTDSRRD